MALSRSALLTLFGAVIALIAIVAVSLQREMTHNPAPGFTATRPPPPPAPPPLTAEEEVFAEALFPLHQEVVEASAGRLTAAGLAYAIDDHNAQRLATKVTTLRQIFHDSKDKAAAIPAPASLAQVRERYVQLLGLYEQSAGEMLEVARDGDEGHLINAQIKSETAAKELVRLGDILWPGEHKPH